MDTRREVFVPSIKLIYPKLTLLPGLSTRKGISRGAYPAESMDSYLTNPPRVNPVRGPPQEDPLRLLQPFEVVLINPTASPVNKAIDIYATAPHFTEDRHQMKYLWDRKFLN